MVFKSTSKGWKLVDAIICRVIVSVSLFIFVFAGCRVIVSVSLFIVVLAGCRVIVSVSLFVFVFARLDSELQKGTGKAGQRKGNERQQI